MATTALTLENLTKDIIIGTESYNPRAIDVADEVAIRIKSLFLDDKMVHSTETHQMLQYCIQRLTPIEGTDSCIAKLSAAMKHPLQERTLELEGFVSHLKTMPAA